VQDAEDDRCGGKEPDAEREIFLILSILPIPLAVAVPVVPVVRVLAKRLID
jgi:hypothetical protein